MKRSERRGEIPLKDAKAGMWARFTLAKDVRDDTGQVRFKAGEFVVRLENGYEDDPFGLMLLTMATGVTSILGMPDEDGIVFPLIQFGPGGVNVAPDVTGLHVYATDPKDAATGRTTVWNGVTPPTIQNARVGDLVTLSNAHYPESAVTGLVLESSHYERDDGPTEHLLHVANKFYDIDGTDTDNTWHIVSLKRRVNWNVDDLPEEPGLYKAATGSVWKYDGRLFVPVLDHKGNPAPSSPMPAQSRKRFMQSSADANRFPFLKVKAEFDVVE